MKQFKFIFNQKHLENNKHNKILNLIIFIYLKLEAAIVLLKVLVFFYQIDI